VFALLTGVVSQHFIASRAIPRAAELSDGEKAIMTRLDEITARLKGIEAVAHPGMFPAAAKTRDEAAGSSS
jgi:hypothetical protein